MPENELTNEERNFLIDCIRELTIEKDFKYDITPDNLKNLLLKLNVDNENIKEILFLAF